MVVLDDLELSPQGPTIKADLTIEKDFSGRMARLTLVELLVERRVCVAPPRVIPEHIPSQRGWCLWCRIKLWYRTLLQPATVIMDCLNHRGSLVKTSQHESIGLNE